MAEQDSIAARIRKFKQALREASFSDELIVRKYITFGTPYIFQENEEQYFHLKEDISKAFEVNPSRVIMIGSAKLGFSIAPSKRWRHVTMESDLDVTIISQDLFDSYWKELFHININLIPRSELEDDDYQKFLRYFFKGWIRPDLFNLKNPKRMEWFEKLKPLYNKYDNRKVTVGIFRSEYFFENYHASNIKEARAEEKNK